MKLKKHYNNIFEALEHAEIINSKEYKDYMAKRPKKKKKPPTEAQRAHYARFGMVNRFAGKITEALRVGLESQKYVTHVNTAVKMYMKDAVCGECPNYELDYAKVKIADGQLGSLPIRLAEIILSDVAVLTWRWREVSGGKDESMHQLYVLLYNRTSDSVMFSGFTSQLLDKRAEFAVRPYQKSDEIHCWVFTYSKDLRATSNSQYLKVSIMD